MSHVARGERWLIIMMLFIVMYKQGVPNPLVAGAFVLVSGGGALYALAHPYIKRGEE